MGAAADFQVKVNENGSATLLGRVTTHDATGSAGGPGEGNCLKQADLSAIAVTVFDTTDQTGNTKTYTAAPTPASCMFDALQLTSVWNSAMDPVQPSLGYNFLLDLPPTAFPGARMYRVEVKWTTTGGTVGWGRYKSDAQRLLNYSA